MRRAPELPVEMRAVLRRQDGAVTAQQLRDAGLTDRQLHTLRTRGWRSPVRGVLVDPAATDRFRASVRAATLACPPGVVAGITAGRLHGLDGLPPYRTGELPALLLPAGTTYEQRTGMKLRSGLQAAEQIWLRGFRATTLDRTVRDLTKVLPPDDLVCVVDSALRKSWRPEIGPGMQRKLRRALALADARSESPLETRLRLLLVRAGLSPETLQLELVDERGVVYARLDMAWPSVKLAIEADGRRYHEGPTPIYRDRVKANRLQVAGWVVLRITWADVLHSPEWVVSLVRGSLNRLSCGRRAG